MQLLGRFVFQHFFPLKDGGSGCVPAFLVKCSFNIKYWTSCLEHRTPERKQRAPKLSTRHQIPPGPDSSIYWEATGSTGENPTKCLLCCPVCGGRFAMASCISNALSDFCQWNYYFPLSNLIRMAIIRMGSYWYLIQASWGVSLRARHNGCVRRPIERWKGTLRAASRRWQSNDAKCGKVNPLLSQAPSSARRHTVL